MLERYLEEMLEIVGDAERHLQPATPADIRVLEAWRARLLTLLSAYQLFIHREVFEPGVRSGSAAASAYARALKVECVILSEDYRAFVRRWPTEAIIPRWADYQAAARVAIGRYRTHAETVGAEAGAITFAPLASVG